MAKATFPITVNVPQRIIKKIAEDLVEYNEINDVVTPQQLAKREGFKALVQQIAQKFLQEYASDDLADYLVESCESSFDKFIKEDVKKLRALEKERDVRLEEQRPSLLMISKKDVPQALAALKELGISTIKA